MLGQQIVEGLDVRDDLLRAVGREDALPVTFEIHGQVVCVTLGRPTPRPHPVRRRSQDHTDALRRDRMEEVAVPAEEARASCMPVV